MGRPLVVGRPSRGCPSRGRPLISFFQYTPLHNKQHPPPPCSKQHPSLPCSKHQNSPQDRTAVIRGRFFDFPGRMPTRSGNPHMTAIADKSLTRRFENADSRPPQPPTPIPGNRSHLHVQRRKCAPNLPGKLEKTSTSFPFSGRRIAFVAIRREDGTR